MPCSKDLQGFKKCSALILLHLSVPIWHVLVGTHPDDDDVDEHSSSSARAEAARGHDSPGPQGSRKKHKRNPLSPQELTGALSGVRIYIIHCKADLERKYDQPIHEVIAGQVRSLVEKRGLGAEIVAAYQGMSICELKCLHARTKRAKPFS